MSAAGGIGWWDTGDLSPADAHKYTIRFKKKEKGTETGQQFTRQMNEIKNDGVKGGRRGEIILIVEQLQKVMSLMFKVLLNEERRAKTGRLEGGV